MIRRFSFVAILSLSLAGCAINQAVTPVERFEGKQICIVINPAVSQPGFLTTYARVLGEKGFAVKQLVPNSALTECPITSTYTANWRWDLGLYMEFADIRVYNNGRQAGQAVYDARSGGANMNKFIRGDAKITELVNQLFPGGAGK